MLSQNAMNVLAKYTSNERPDPNTSINKPTLHP
jgi:hypothetical protein